jgi:hypothetical protein
VARAIRDTLLRSEEPSLAGVPVIIEAEITLAEVPAGWIGVYRTGRQIESNQPLAAGRSYRVDVLYSIWCYGYSISEEQASFEMRDSLISKVEEILALNRTLGGELGVLVTQMNGGQDFSGRGENSQFFSAAGSVDVVVEVRGTV